MTDIFISYASEDKSDAKRLVEEFEAQGFDVWWDRESLPGGKSINREIQQALERAKCVVVLWSCVSVNKKWVESEASWAWDKNKFHSVRLDDAVVVPVPFNTVHARSLAGWDGSADFDDFKRLTEDIIAVVGLAPRKPEPPAPLTRVKTPRDEELLQRVVSRDPVVAFQAVESLGTRPDLFERLIDIPRRKSPVNNEALRRVLRTDPAASAKLLKDRCFKDDSTLTSWDRATQSIAYLEPFHGQYWESILRDIVRNPRIEGGDVDRKRVAVEAIGRCLPSYWGIDLLHWLEVDWSHYEWEKLGYRVPQALARMAMNETDDIRNVFSRLVECLKITDSSRWREFVKGDFTLNWDLSLILQGCGARHIDALITEMLGSDVPSAQELAASTLGRLRVSRAVPQLAKAAERSLEKERVVTSCACALGKIGTPDAVRWLLRTSKGDPCYAGFIDVLHLLPTSDQKKFAGQYLEGDNSQKWVVIRALGLSGVSDALDLILPYRYSEHPWEREAAVYALFRLGKMSEAELESVIREASGPGERLFARLALMSIVPSRVRTLIIPIREDLAIESYRYSHLLQQDILKALVGSGNLEAIEVADDWRPFYFGLKSG